MKNSKLNLIILTLSLQLFFLFNLSLSAEEIRIGFSDDIPPFVMNKGVDGLEVEIVREALKYKGYKFTVQQGSYKWLETAVVNNEVDAAAGVLKMSDGTHYSDYFIAFENYAITKKNSGIILKNIQDLKGKDIITWENAYKDLGREFENIFSKDIKEPYIKKYNEIPIQKEQVKLFWSKPNYVLIIDKYIFIWFTKHLFNGSHTNDEVVYHKIFTGKTEFQINFKSKKMRDDFNEGLKYIQQTGLYQKIFDKYLK